jgi:hypothetical protein
MWKFLRCGRTLPAIAAIVILVGCDKSPTAPTPDPTPVPLTVSSVSPTPLIRSNVAQVVTVAGNGFRAGLTVKVMDPTGNPVTVATGAVQNISTTSLQVTVTLPVAGRYGVILQQADGETSSQLPFDVFDPAPQIDSVSPALTIIDSDPQPVALIGSRFSAALTLRIVEPDGVVSERTTPGFSVDGDSLIQFMMVFTKVGSYTFTVRQVGGLASNAIEVRVR